MGEFAPAVPTSGYVAVLKNKRIEYKIFAGDALYSDTLYDFRPKKRISFRTPGFD
jgi:hypothetical protein